MPDFFNIADIFNFSVKPAACVSLLLYVIAGIVIIQMRTTINVSGLWELKLSVTDGIESQETNKPSVAVSQRRASVNFKKIKIKSAIKEYLYLPILPLFSRIYAFFCSIMAA